MLGRENLAFCMAIMAPIIAVGRDIRAYMDSFTVSKHSVINLIPHRED